MILSSAWVGPSFLLALVIAVVSVTAVIIQMRANISTLKERDSERARKDDEIDKQAVDMLIAFKEFVACQSKMNVITEAFMKAQTDINQKLLVEVGHMTKASTEGSQVISLLTEVLRQKKVIAGPE